MSRHRAKTDKPHPAKTKAWVHDAIYLAMSFVVWNWRKSRYQKSNGSIRCPCQSLSDSGRVGESRCEASYYLKDPRRFSIVCPALKPTAIGLRCHLTLEKVRPYWGRAFAAGFLLLVSCYVAGASGWFGVQRLQGYSQVSWTDCVWPPHWHQVSVARAIQFRQHADTALAQGDLPETIRTLSSAVHEDSGNWSNALLLAQLYEQVGQFAASEGLFHTLTTLFPEQDQLIAGAHHDAMVASLRFDSVQDLAWRQLGSATQPSVEWFYVLLAATAESSNPDDIWTVHTERCAQLPSEFQAILGLVALPPGHTLDHATKTALAVESKDPALAWLRIDFLLTKKLTAAAREALIKDLKLLQQFDAELARWRTLRPDFPALLAISEWKRLVKLANETEQLSRLCAVTLKSSWALPLAEIRTRIRSDDYTALADLWAVANFKGDLPLAGELLGTLKLDAQNTAFQIGPDTARQNLPLITSQLKFSREVQYAIIEASRPVPTALVEE
jgi:hypothetical protein